MNACCAYDKCAKEYIRIRPFQRFCSKRCRNKDWKSGKKEKKYRRMYKAVNKEKLNRKSREYYWLKIKGLSHVPEYYRKRERK